MSLELTPEFDAGEADYFSALLAMQNANQHRSKLPQVLLEAVQFVVRGLESEGVSPVWPKPLLLNAAELAAFGTAENIMVFERQNEGAQTIIALNNTAVNVLATMLLGGKPTLSMRAPSRIESQIAQGFVETLHVDFKLVETPQTSILWQDFAGSKMPFDDIDCSAFILVMVNRRAETAAAPLANVQDVHQQNHIKQALSHSVLNVDYVLGGGQMALSSLRNLEVGSVVALASLNEMPVEARANGKVIFGGVLNLTPNQMRFGVTHILAEGRND